MLVTHGKIYDVCLKCGQLVRLNKPFVGSLHICRPANEDVLRCDECGKSITKTVAVACPDDWKFYDGEKAFFCPPCFDAITMEM